MANVNDFCNYINWKYGSRYTVEIKNEDNKNEIIIKGYSDKYDDYVFIGTLYWDDMTFESPCSIYSDHIYDGGNVFECFAEECEYGDAQDYLHICPHLIDDCINNQYNGKDLVEHLHSIDTSDASFEEMCELTLSMIKFFIDEYIETLKDIYFILVGD